MYSSKEEFRMHAAITAFGALIAKGQSGDENMVADMAIDYADALTDKFFPDDQDKWRTATAVSN